MDYDRICYKNSCLSQVIIRLDFLEFINMDVLQSPAIEKEVLLSFPKKGMQQIIRFQTMNVTTDKGGTRAEQTTRDGIQQEFSNVDGNKIILSNKFVILEINKYTKYEDVLDLFVHIIKTLFNTIQLTSMRTGIRYINFFGENGIKPQKNFFSSSVGALLDAKQGNNSCIRSMAMNEYVVDDMHLNFRFGMYNPQYPQGIKKPNYVLDYDCYCDEALAGFDTILGHIHDGHDAIQKLFETSITEQLCKVMKYE